MIRVTRTGWLMAFLTFISFIIFHIGFQSRDQRTLIKEDLHEAELQSQSNVNIDPATGAPLPYISSPDYNTFQHPGAIKHTDVKVEIEQIQADFANGYTNPNDWFDAPATPVLADEMAKLTAEEKATVESLRSSSSVNTKERIRKMNSLWNVDGTERTWQDHIHSLDDEGLAPLTKWAQQYIYDHQHPKSCAGKEFYVLSNEWPKHGLGAIIRRVMVEMTFAINTGRILVFDPTNAPGGTLVEDDCGVDGYPSLHCVVEDISGCGAYVTKSNSVYKLSSTHVEENDYPRVVMASLYASMEDSGVKATGTYARYWWRSQMYGYIMRPRPTAMKRMLQLRQQPNLQMGVQLERPKGKSYLDVSFPLPPSTVSIHIRHGNKANEGLLVSTRDYIVAAERFILRNPLSYRKRAFVSTEDPRVITEMMQTPYINPSLSFANTDWLWYYSDIPRVNWGPKQNLEATGNKTDGLLMHMMQLFMALECDAFVGNRNSNWNKMIDALRCTLMDKCKLPYVDAGFVADWEHFP